MHIFIYFTCLAQWSMHNANDLRAEPRTARADSNHTLIRYLWDGIHGCACMWIVANWHRAHSHCAQNHSTVHGTSCKLCHKWQDEGAAQLRWWCIAGVGLDFRWNERRARPAPHRAMSRAAVHECASQSLISPRSMMTIMPRTPHWGVAGSLASAALCDYPGRRRHRIRRAP